MQRAPAVPAPLAELPEHAFVLQDHLFHEPVENVVLRLAPEGAGDHVVAGKADEVGDGGELGAVVGLLFVGEEVAGSGGWVAGEGGAVAVSDDAGGLPEHFEEDGVLGS